MLVLSHGGRTIFASDAPSSQLWVATADGLYLLTRSARGAWEISRKVLEGRHVSAVDVHGDVLVAGMHNGGVAVSEDGGKTWEFRNEGLSFLNVYAVHLCWRDGRYVLYVGTEPVHLFVSEDLGRHWRELIRLRQAPSAPEWRFPAPPNLAHVKFLTSDPRDSQTLYACIEQGGLLRSRDGGETWEDLTGRGFNDDCHRLVIRPSAPEQMFIPTGFGLYQTCDGGETWEDISERIRGIGYPDLMVYHPYDDRLLFLAGAGSIPFVWAQRGTATPRIARSRDGGRSWEFVGGEITDILTSNFEAMSVEGWAGGSVIYVGNTDGEVYMSEDEGERWVRIASGLPPISKGGHYLLLKYGLRGLAEYDAYLNPQRLTTAS